jgi:hypothetical protein
LLSLLLLFFAQLPPLVELLAAWSWKVALAVVIAWVCRSFRFSCSFFFLFLRVREVRIARGDGLRWWSVGFSALSVGSVPTPSPLRVDEGGFSRRYPTRDVQYFWLPLLRWLPWSLESVGVVAFRVLFPAPGSRIVSLLSAMQWFGGYVGNWFNGWACHGGIALGSWVLVFRGRWELPGEMGCGGGPWVLALWSTEALIFYDKEKK